jgi:DNA (cytosine-5)-methyltransferase 1
VSRPKLLDLFCGAGGSAVGYHRAGFDVVGVDIKPQPRYPFPFVQGDALNPPCDLSAFDAIHASPPCQAYSITKHSHSKEHPDLLPRTRAMLVESGVPWVIENVPGAPMPAAFVLCGASFGLKSYDPATGLQLWLQRHRWFESSVAMWAAPHACKGKEIGGVYGGGSVDRSHDGRRGGYTPAAAVRSSLMGIDWMDGAHLNQAIPPAYTEFIGEQLLAAL